MAGGSAAEGSRSSPAGRRFRRTAARRPSAPSTGSHCARARQVAPSEAEPPRPAGHVLDLSSHPVVVARPQTPRAAACPFPRLGRRPRSGVKTIECGDGPGIMVVGCAQRRCALESSLQCGRQTHRARGSMGSRFQCIGGAGVSEFLEAGGEPPPVPRTGVGWAANTVNAVLGRLQQVGPLEAMPGPARWARRPRISRARRGFVYA